MTAVSALLAGEIDFYEQIPHDLLPLVEGNPDFTADVYRKHRITSYNVCYTKLLRLPCASSGGGSDANFSGALRVASLCSLGATGDGLHTLNEHILASSLAPRARLMAGLFLTLGA